MKRRLAIVYAITCMLLLVAGFVFLFFLAWKEGTQATVAALCGFVAGIVLAPVLHETGHIAFGRAVGMYCVYAKFFCFKYYRKQGKGKLSLASPFAPDETQMLPKRGGNMQSRARKYTLGGLFVGGAFLFLLLAGAIVCSCVGKTNYLLWGAVPNAAYLFLLNVAPFEYASGKTDALVARGIRKGYDGEKCMLAAMEIQGQLFEGKRFCEIDKSLYFDLPQLCEDEPLYAILLDLRYRYYLDVDDFDGAADSLNRLVAAEEYFSEAETQKVAAELVYMHAVGGDLQRAEESGKLCQAFLKSQTLAAKRILAAYSFAAGKAEEGEALLAQAEELLSTERILGVRKLEESLLSRIKK